LAENDFEIVLQSIVSLLPLSEEFLLHAATITKRTMQRMMMFFMKISYKLPAVLLSTQILFM
jgi:hypothetical protein